MPQGGYNHQLDEFQSIGIQLKPDELDILEIFTQYEALTAMLITNIIKSTNLEMAYKNAYNTMQRLKKRKLIDEVAAEKVRNNEKYFKLTDDGIYQLFLNRPYGILSDQLSVKKGQWPVSYVDRFLRCYGDNLVFKLFLYPYFERQTISVDNFSLLPRLFRYVSECCKWLEFYATIGQAILFIPKFSWDKVPGEDDNRLFESLREIGALKNEKNIQLEKSFDGNTISVVTLQNVVTVSLDITARKAVVYIDNIETYVYKITVLGSEITAGSTQQSEDPIKRAFDSNRKLIEPYIFELVSNVSEEEIRVLARDTKFMLLLESIAAKFESGHNRLLEVRKSL